MSIYKLLYLIFNRVDLIFFLSLIIIVNLSIVGTINALNYNQKNSNSAFRGLSVYESFIIIVFFNSSVLIFPVFLNNRKLPLE